MSEMENKTDSPVDPLDALVRRGLSEQLDRHVGRAADAFLFATADAQHDAMAHAEPAAALTPPPCTQGGGWGEGRSANNATRAPALPKSGNVRALRSEASTLRLWWAVPLLAAAAVVAMFAAPVFRQSITEQRNEVAGGHGVGEDNRKSAVPPIDLTDSPTGTTLASYDPTDVGGAVQWASRDEGMVWLDDETPARKIRRQGLQTIQWTDPHDRSRVEITVPKEEIVLVSSPKL
jgi:hypothetical protein